MILYRSRSKFNKFFIDYNVSSGGTFWWVRLHLSIGVKGPKLTIGCRSPTDDQKLDIAKYSKTKKYFSKYGRVLFTLHGDLSSHDISSLKMNSHSSNH